MLSPAESCLENLSLSGLFLRELAAGKGNAAIPQAHNPIKPLEVLTLSCLIHLLAVAPWICWMKDGKLWTLPVLLWEEGGMNSLFLSAKIPSPGLLGTGRSAYSCADGKGAENCAIPGILGVSATQGGSKWEQFGGHCLRSHLFMRRMLWGAPSASAGNIPKSRAHRDHGYITGAAPVSMKEFPLFQPGAIL